ncbi:hypothetical protein TNCV_2422921 [Trichonephila clavipes]|nr:hypothetical protein TNCV_2422921 [Trichonephila clavipes]
MVNFRPRTPLKNSCVRYCMVHTKNPCLCYTGYIMVLWDISSKMRQYHFKVIKTLHICEWRDTPASKELTCSTKHAEPHHLSRQVSEDWQSLSKHVTSLHLTHILIISKSGLSGVSSTWEITSARLRQERGEDMGTKKIDKIFIRMQIIPVSS